MDIVVGKFHLNTNGKLSKEEVRKIFLHDFPSVTVSDLEKELDRLYGKDKPNNTTEKAKESGKPSTEPSGKVVERK